MRIYIDSNVFVSCVIVEEAEHERSKKFIDAVLNNTFQKDISFFTSRFTEIEVASAIFRRTKNEDKARATLHKIERPWSNKIFPLPEDPKEKIKIDDFVIKLVETALKNGTNFGDSIHANHVESYAIDYLVTWNLKDFKKLETNVNSLKVVTPEQMLNVLNNSDKK